RAAAAAANACPGLLAAYVERGQQVAQFEFMARCATEVVDDHPVTGTAFYEQDASAMRNWIAQVAVRVVHRLDEIDVDRTCVMQQARGGPWLAPCKGSGRLSLTDAIDHHRAVRARAAKVVAPFV